MAGSYRKKLFIGLLLGTACWIAALALVFVMGREGASDAEARNGVYLMLLACLIGWGFYIWGCGCQAAGKGYHWGVGLLGLLGLFGALIIGIFPRQEGESAP
jgi:MYXO-CTERM domain-containing protein